MVEMYKPVVTYDIGWIKNFLENKHMIKPRYRINFFMDGTPKSCEGPQFWYAFHGGRFRRAANNYGIMARKDVKEWQ